MRIRVDLGGWEHECCGRAYEVGDDVTMTLYLPMGGTLSGDADYMESHHVLLIGGSDVRGEVVGVEALGPDGVFVSVIRLPSAAEISDDCSPDSSRFLNDVTGKDLTNEPDEFIVVLDVPEGCILPTRTARSAP
jgi:hypothetical protein